ncbi:MAG: type IV secretion system DNA-binding domain-containing protein [Jaaginema sp. PMC 1079.18]|nr:type IV secretion system DNA-binding domain-containing protein [Jaaginema sp. PMC 1080.18]MEC4852506.1 type IV secretion system DNA-binding domain-containing protein [Jaaginema sp. PMC 1079.18]
MKITATTTTQALERVGEQLAPLITSPTGWTLLGLVVLASLLSLGDNGKKGKLSTSYFGGTTPKKRAKTKAIAQIKHPKRNSVSLYVGCPPIIHHRLQAQWLKAGYIQKMKRTSHNQTLWLPDLQRGCSVLGAAGSGKTFSVIDPLARAAVDLGYPVCLYDFKYPAQTSRLVAYALKRGYTVRVFAPGFPESETCNPLDLIEDEEDAIAAGQLAQVINRNCDRGGLNAGGDKFFEEAGDNLVEGIFLATKAIANMVEDGEQYCDLMTAQALLSLSNLPARLELAILEGRLSPWTSRPLSQVISVKDSEKTVAGIIGTAQKTFQRFVKKEFIGAFCGRTTLPLDIEGKQLVIFGLDRNNRDIVGPLLASILHTFVTRNVSRTEPRSDPMVCVLDEIPTIFLPQLVKWLNENREDGFVGILGYQNIGQMEKAYGKELTRAIIGGTATKFIFNPQDYESAKYFADYLGEQDIEYQSKSRSFGKNSRSRSISNQRQKRYLIEPAQLLKMETGQAVIINPAMGEGGEAYIPIQQKIKVPKADIAEMEESIGWWPEYRHRCLQRQHSQLSSEERSRQFDERFHLVERLFPLPSELTETSNEDLPPTSGESWF